MNELKPEDVMKALECCRYGGRCGECPCFEILNCQALTNDAALALLREKDARIKELEYILLGVMHSVDKWLDGAELEQDEVNRAGTMREKTLKIVEEKDAEIERLREMNDALASGFDTVKDYVAQTMRRRLKESAFGDCIVKGEKHWVISDKNIDKIIKGER